MEKTVYVLGAGASVSAKLPTQNGIISLIFSIFPDSIIDSNTSSNFMNLRLDDREQRMWDFYPRFEEYRQRLGEFIVSNFSTRENAERYHAAIAQANQIQCVSLENQRDKQQLLARAYTIVNQVGITLEDLFTIFDNVSVGREHFRQYSLMHMTEIHNQLKMCVIYALTFSIVKEKCLGDYQAFAQKIFNARLKSAQQEDSLSVITMNWDDVFEQAVSKICNAYNMNKKPKSQMIYPDLCFYNYDLSQKKKHIPSVNIKAKGHKNIKILKMHGSLAWLECPRCGRIFTDFSDEIASEEFAEMHCPKCVDDIPENGERPILRNLIITPTFLKSFDSLNLKNIWHNAFIDLCEADHIVFIGYSFPDADFEMRCLLKKAVRENTDITVVLSEYDNPDTIRKQLKTCNVDDDMISSIVNRMHLPEERYKSFFGRDKVVFEYKGFGSYIKKMGKRI